MTHSAAVSAHRTVEVLARRQGGVVLARQALEAGLPRDQIRVLVRQGRWAAMHHGVYLTTPPTARGPGGRPPLLARAWAAHLRCGPSSVIGLGTAARLLRLRGLSTEPPHVDVYLPRGRHPRPDLRLRLHLAALGPGEVVRRRGLPLTSVARTLADLLLRLPEEQGLGLLDSALHQGLLVDLSAVDRALRYRPRADPARSLLPLADGRAAAPLESAVRLDCVRGGVAPDQLQVARSAFCWHRGLRRPLLGETCGRREGPARSHRNGQPLLRFTWADVIEPGGAAALVRAALDELRVSRAAGPPEVPGSPGPAGPRPPEPQPPLLLPRPCPDRTSLPAQRSADRPRSSALWTPGPPPWPDPCP
jgi:hypothetical protein